MQQHILQYKNKLLLQRLRLRSQPVPLDDNTLEQCNFHLKNISSQIAHAHLEAKQLQRELHIHELNIAWRARQMAEAWQWARLATFTAKGNKRKWGSAPIPTQPTVAQVVQHLKKPAEQGGWAAACMIWYPR